MTPRCCGLALLSMGVAACVAPCTARQTAWNWQSVLKALQQSKSPYAKRAEQMLNSSANTQTFKQTVSCIQAFNSTSGKAKCSQKLAPNFCADSTCMDHLASKKCSACGQVNKTCRTLLAAFRVNCEAKGNATLAAIKACTDNTCIMSATKLSTNCNTTKDLDVLGVARIAQQMREGCKQGSAAAQAANASNLTNAKNLAQVLTAVDQQKQTRTDLLKTMSKVRNMSAAKQAAWLKNTSQTALKTAAQNAKADPAASKLLQNVTNGKVKPDDALKQLLALAKKNNINISAGDTNALKNFTSRYSQKDLDALRSADLSKAAAQTGKTLGAPTPPPAKPRCSDAACSGGSRDAGLGATNAERLEESKHGSSSGSGKYVVGVAFLAIAGIVAYFAVSGKNKNTEKIGVGGAGAGDDGISNPLTPAQ